MQMKILFLLTSTISFITFSFSDSSSVQMWQQIVSDVLNTSFRNSLRLQGTVYIFCPEIEPHCIDDQFLAQLPIPWMIVVKEDYSINIAVLSDIADWDHVVIIAEDAEQAVDLIRRLRRGIGSNIIVVLDILKPQYLRRYAGKVTKALWSINGVNILIIPLYSESPQTELDMYTLDPFRDPEHCFDTTPVLVNTQSFLTDYHTFNRVFPRNRVYNLNGCRLIITTFSGYGVELDKGDDGMWIVSGPAAQVLESVSGCMNFTPLIVPIDDGELWGFVNNETSAGIRGAVYRNEAHMSFQMVFHQDTHVFDYDDNLKTDCLGFCLPLKKPKHSLWWNLVNEFTIGVWFLLSASLGVTCLMVRIIGRYSKAENVYRTSPPLLVFGLLLSSSTVAPKSFPGRLFFSHFFLFCIVITTAYQAAQKSMYMSPMASKDVNTVEDLAASDLKIVIFRSSIDYVRNFPAALDANALYLSDAEYDVYYSNFRAGRFGVLTTSSICKIYSETGAAKNYSRFLTYMLPHFCMETIPWHFFTLAKLSPLANTLTYASSRVVENGFVKKFLREMSSDDYESGKANLRKGIFDLEYFFSALLMLVAGMYVGFMVFLIEVCTKRYSSQDFSIRNVCDMARGI